MRNAAALAAFLMAVSCATNRGITVEDEQVLSAVVDQLCRYHSNGYDLLSSLSAVVNPNFTPTNMDVSARQSLLDRNRSAASLPEFNTCEGLRRTDAKEIDNYLENPSWGAMRERWAAFYKRYVDAKGVMTLSLPGYSKSGDVAIVQVSGACNDLCGSGFFWVLRKVAGRWQVDPHRVIQGWTSKAVPWGGLTHDSAEAAT